ncbi:MAG: ATP-dependent helicase [Eubacterium sp.]|nr:ATP-dependent helicase [Eubacterium sp.]
MYHKEQRRAIEHVNGPALILAGPGSGKTTVIVERIHHLIEQEKVPPEKILVVTFTKAAALHMKQRFLKREGRVLPVTFGTFHSVFYGILKKTYGSQKMMIISEQEKLKYIRQCVIRLKIDCHEETDYVMNVANEIGRIKGNPVGIDSYESLYCDTEDFRKIYRAYESMLRAEGRMDFDDILLQTKELFLRHPEVLEEWRSLYSQILIDEFQDINGIQYEIMKMLSEPENNLFVVGDDDQSIYGFRGAKPEMMFQFEKDYPERKKVLLEINYRCHGSLVDYSKKLIEKNAVRFPKKLCAARTEGKAVTFRKFPSQLDEMQWIVKEIKRLQAEGIPEEEIAILVRNNNQIPMVQKVLQNAGIMGKGNEQTGLLYRGMVALELQNYIKAALLEKERELNENEAVVAILNKPERLISREVLLKKGMTWEQLRKEYEHHPEAIRHIESLEFHLKMIRKLPPFAAINYIRKGVGYEAYLKQYAGENHFPVTELMEQLEAIQNQSYGMKTHGEWLQFLEEQQKTDRKAGTGIRLLTMHGAKGLEFYAVFLPDMNQGIIPSKKVIREKEFEEERRVLYVAMTRAREELHLSGVMEQLGTPMELSMFMDEILN